MVDNIKSWTGLSVEESIRMTEDRDKWRKYVHGVANPRIKDGYGRELNQLKFLAMFLRHLVPWPYGDRPRGTLLSGGQAQDW